MITEPKKPARLAKTLNNIKYCKVDGDTVALIYAKNVYHEAVVYVDVEQIHEIIEKVKVNADEGLYNQNKWIIRIKASPGYDDDDDCEVAVAVAQLGLESEELFAKRVAEYEKDLAAYKFSKTDAYQEEQRKSRLIKAKADMEAKAKALRKAELLVADLEKELGA